MATIRKRNGKYQVQIRRSEQSSISRTFRNRADAVVWARTKEIEYDKGVLPPDTKSLRNISLGELVVRYRDEVVPKKRHPEIETCLLNAFLRNPICKVNLLQLRSSHFAFYRDERLNNVSPVSLKRELAPLSHMFEVARKEWGVPIIENPLNSVRLKAPDLRRQRRLRDGEFEHLILEAQRRKNPLIEKVIQFALETAMRRGEILSLRWGQVDLERLSASILESKNGYSRVIPLTPSAIAVLDDLDRLEDRVFPITPNALRLAWGRMTKVAGIEDLHFHDLRHEAISRYFELGLTVPEVASISGHRDLRMLLRYAHASFPAVQAKLKS